MKSSSNEIDHVVVWPNAWEALRRGLRRYWSISLCDADRDEIVRLEGDQTIGAAWSRGCAAAESYHVRCVEEDDAGRVLGRYMPPERYMEGDHG